MWLWRGVLDGETPLKTRPGSSGPPLPAARHTVVPVQRREDVHVASEWYRSPEWHDAAREDFEARLRRARPHNRQQYLRIKGLSLRAAGNLDGAREILERAAEAPDGYFFQSMAAWEALADMDVESGDLTSAELLYRRILIQQPSSGSTGTVEISLAEVLLASNRTQNNDEILALLNTWLERPGLKFDNQLFRWHLDLIRLAERIGDGETVQRAARTALNLAERRPQLPRHPDVGLVMTDRATLGRLRKLSK